LANNEDEPENALLAAKRVAEVLAPGAVKAAAGAMREASMMIFIVVLAWFGDLIFSYEKMEGQSIVSGQHTARRGLKS
jgi:hypothetical protein